MIKNEFSESALLDFALQTLCPNSQYTFNDADYSTINWIKLDGKAPTQFEIDATIERIKADQIALAEQKATEKAALLTRLGITADEAKLLLS